MAIGAQLNTRAGSGTIGMGYSVGDIEIFPNTTVEVGEVGVIEVDFDLEEDADAAENVFFAPGSLKFSFFDRLGNGGSLFEQIKLISTGDSVELELDFTTDGGYSFFEIYTFQKTDIKYNRLERTVEIEATAKIDSSLTIHDIFLAFPEGIQPAATGAFGGDIMRSSHFINFYRQEAFPTANYFNDSHAYSPARTLNSGEEYFVIEDVESPEMLAHEELYKMAAIDGDIVGRMLGHFFIVNRSLTTITPSIISENDVEKLNIEVGLESYHLAESIFVEYDNPNQTGPEHIILNRQTPQNSDLNENGIKSLSVYFSSWHMKRCFWDGSQFDRNEPYYTEVDLSGDHEEGDRVLDVNTTSGLGVGDQIIFRSLAISSLNIYPREIYEIENVDSVNNQVTIDPPLQRFLSDDNAGSRIMIPADDDIVSPAIMENAVNGYKAAYGATGEDVVQMTVLDIDSLDPYDIIRFDSSFPAGLANETYRPSKITYNIIEDKIELEAYSIE